MPFSKEEARKEIQELANRFISRQVEYESGDYKESQLRLDFINDLFVFLGWDVGNKTNLSPLQREVLVEKGETKGIPDYSFRVNGEDTFFVEAKSVSKGTDKSDDIFQAKRYGWNTLRVNIVILTNFNTFKVFDASLKPNVNQPKIGLLFELKCANFATTEFEKLWQFSREEVIKGSLEKLALKDATSKRLRIPVDIAFLEQMTSWRETLAKDIYKNNPNISVSELNDVVQRLLDRLVFIHILEDRKIIESKTLREIVEDWAESKHRDIQTPLNVLFHKLNDDFNGNIFKQHPCESTVYDSKVIAEIIDELYYPKSPYDFAVIGVELLGIIYEKYLGKTIRLTEKRVKVEEKPEVRKAGGVYYTPKWVVKYIVDNTVGEFVDEKTPEEISKLRILDPACGSGSFLIGALEKLFQHHLHYYSEHLKEAKHGTLFPHLIIEHDDDGNEIYRLSIETKGQILKNNIYGVDIDAQACEITMMSLYIKVLEGEKTLPHNKELLPSLSNNIRCGNSLIDFDFLSQQKLIDDTTKQRINPFEWRSKTTGFGNIIGEKDGFDVVIGNPPYLSVKRGFFKSEQEYLESKYQTAKGQYDFYRLFIERGLILLKQSGLLGFIIPRRSFTNENDIYLRDCILKQCNIKRLVDVGTVFSEASVEAGIIVLCKGEPIMSNEILREMYTPSGTMISQYEPLTQARILSDPNLTFNIQMSSIKQKLLDKIESGSIPFEKISSITRGVEIGKTSEFLTKSSNEFPIIFGEDVTKYSIADRPLWIKFSKFDASTFKKESLYHQSKKILIRRVGSELISTIDDQKRITLNTLYVVELNPDYTPEYLCGLLNSKLIGFWFRNRFVITEKIFPYVRISQLNKIPIKKDKTGMIEQLVNKIIELNKQKQSIRDTSKKELFEREAKVYKEKIDHLVYNIYGLNENEIEIVENSQ